MQSNNKLSPSWFLDLLSVKDELQEGDVLKLRNYELVMKENILRNITTLSDAQLQTENAFSFKWKKRDTFEENLSKKLKVWLMQKYGDVCSSDWFKSYGDSPLVLDAGCGAALSAMELFSSDLKRIRYIGVDVSSSVEIARQRFLEKGLNAAFIQTDLQQIPLSNNIADVIFSEGVLHHTDDTKASLAQLIPLLKDGGRILFYVYRAKGPIREFTDDYIRDYIQSLPPKEAWELLMPLSKLGHYLGDLNIEINVPEEIELLGIPSGPINLQRFFYWHIFKAFYSDELSFDEMHHINFDWYAPKNAHRHTVEEVQSWCDELGLVVEHENVELAGITIIARKKD